MKILLINSVCGIGSTGRICIDLAEQFKQEGNEVKIAYGRDGFVPEKYQQYAVRIGNNIDVKLHGLRTRILDAHGFGSKKATKDFLKWADEYKPDLLWLHNIHGYYINVEMLFGWIKNNPNMQVKWTLHDCWAFTGHCAYFTIAKCDKWKKHCSECVQKKRYPTSNFLDRSMENYDRKKMVFTGVKNMTLITPSQWLADLVKESFLKEYPVRVQQNKRNTSIFKPTISKFREKYEIENKTIVLGVASVWDERKGLKDFVKLARMLDDSYAIVLVGLTQEQLEEAQKHYAEKTENIVVEELNNSSIVRRAGGVAIPANVNLLYQEIIRIKEGVCRNGLAKIICIPRTNNIVELAEIYTAADVFVNPTYEDNYPTVNLEAQACGTKVVTYNIGGCVETLEEFN